METNKNTLKVETTITVKIGDMSLGLNLDQARQLYAELSNILGKNNTPPYVITPVSPNLSPNITYPPPITPLVTYTSVNHSSTEV